MYAELLGHEVSLYLIWAVAALVCFAICAILGVIFVKIETTKEGIMYTSLGFGLISGICLLLILLAGFFQLLVNLAIIAT